MTEGFADSVNQKEKGRNEHQETHEEGAQARQAMVEAHKSRQDRECAVRT